jgi:PadR family transcriptional regulator PadR
MSLTSACHRPVATRAPERPYRRARFAPPLPLDLTLSDVGKVRIVTGPIRITGPLLDVVEVFLQAFHEDAQLHGWAITKTTKRSGPTVYGVLDRLEDLGWIIGRWEEQDPESNKPRRRLYRLTPTGVSAARDLLATRRPQALHPTPQHPQPRPEPGLAFLGWLCTVLLPGGAP